MTPPVPLLFTVLTIASTNHLCAHPWNERSLCLVPLGRRLSDRERNRARTLRLANAGLAALAIALLWSSPGPRLELLATCLPLLGTAGLIALMVSAGRSQADREPARFAVPKHAPPPMGAYISPALHLLHGTLLVVCGGVFVALLEHMPARVPIHWNGMGQPDRYGAPSALWGLGGIMAFDWLLALALAYGIARERWALPADERVHARYTALQMKRRALTVRLTESITLGTNVGLGAMWAGIAMGAARGDAAFTNTSVMASVVLLGLGILLPLGLCLKPLSRVQSELRTIAGTDVLGTRERGWRWGGLLYFAPDDPALFVPKRIGLGQTLNMARPGAWIFLAVVLGAPLLLMWLVSAVR